MPAMTVRFLVGLVALALLAPLPASAQFYDLDGAYRCLTQPDAGCEKDLSDAPKTAPTPSGPSLEQVIARVRSKTAGPADIDFLEKRVEAKDPRAVEVLAWCRLNGIGGTPDPVAAYWLYRQAASLGVPNARQNQIAVFETRLTPEQRQQVLNRENAQ
jgi:TPR repeat protein